MKTVEYYMSLPYKMEIMADEDEGGFVASFPDLPGCLTCGDTVEQAMKNANNAKKTWIEAAIEDQMEIAEPMK